MKTFSVRLREAGLELQKKRFDGGLISEFDYRQLEAEAAATRAQMDAGDGDGMAVPADAGAGPAVAAVPAARHSGADWAGRPLRVGPDPRRRCAAYAPRTSHQRGVNGRV